MSLCRAILTAFLSVPLLALSLALSCLGWAISLLGEPGQETWTSYTARSTVYTSLQLRQRQGAQRSVSSTSATWSPPNRVTTRWPGAMLAVLLLVTPLTTLTSCSAKTQVRTASRPVLPVGEPVDPSPWLRGLKTRIQHTPKLVTLSRLDWRELLELIRDHYDWGEALEAGADWKREGE